MSCPVLEFQIAGARTTRNWRVKECWCEDASCLPLSSELVRELFYEGASVVARVRRIRARNDENHDPVAQLWKLACRGVPFVFSAFVSLRWLAGRLCHKRRSVPLAKTNAIGVITR